MNQAPVPNIENRIDGIIAAIEGLADFLSSMDARGGKADFCLSLVEAKDNLLVLRSLLGIETAPKKVFARVETVSTILQELSALKSQVEMELVGKKKAKIAFDAKAIFALIDATETAINRFQTEARGN